MNNYVFARILFTKGLCINLSLLPIIGKRKGTDKVSQHSLNSLVIGFVLVNFWSLKMQNFATFKK